MFRGGAQPETSIQAKTYENTTPCSGSLRSPILSRSSSKEKVCALSLRDQPANKTLDAGLGDLVYRALRPRRSFAKARDWPCALRYCQLELGDRVLFPEPTADIMQR